MDYYMYSMYKSYSKVSYAHKIYDTTTYSEVNIVTDLLHNTY